MSVCQLLHWLSASHWQIACEKTIENSQEAFYSHTERAPCQAPTSLQSHCVIKAEIAGQSFFDSV